MKMSNEVSKQQTWPKDNFGWEPDMESTGGEVVRPVRSMQGEIKLKFVSPNWSADGVECNGRELICYDKTYAVIRWNDDNMPEEVIPLARGAPCPNLTEMNAAIPQSQWRTGLNGNPEPPYQLQRCLEFLNPKNMERLSWPHNITVVGSSRAAEELEGRIKITRRLRGEDVYPMVKLESKHMPTRYGGRERPCLSIIDWVRLGEHGIERIEVNVTTQPQLERVAKAGPAKSAQQSVLPIQSVPEVTLKEEIADDIPWK
jgi:hypothetical protein